MQRPGKRTHSGEPCDVCGGVGGANYEEWMVTCTRCRTARVHVYCMHFYFPEISVEWVCESCCSRDVVSLEDGVKEDTLITMPQDSSTRACHDNVHELGPSSVQQACSEREIKPVKSGKVKYISLDEVIILSAAASKKGASARSNSDPKPDSSSSMKPLWNSLPGSRAAASKSSASMVKSNRSLGPSDPMKQPRHGGGVSSMVDQQVPQTSKKLKDGNFRDVDECKISDVDETDLLNVLSKFRLYHYNLPAVDATWKGGFHLSATCKFYGGFQAQPSCIINRKAFNFSKGMPSIFQVEFVPRSQIWANLFHDNCPDVSDIALYFFTADNIESSKEDMNCLFELMEVHKSMMKSCVDGVELLIFISKDLYLPSQSELSLCSRLHFYIVASAFPYCASSLLD